MTGQELLDQAVSNLFERFRKAFAKIPANADMTEGQMKALLAAGLKTVHCDDLLFSLREHAYWMKIEQPTD